MNNKYSIKDNMKIVKVDLFIRENIIDSQGDKFSAEVLKSFHNQKVLVSKNFDHSKLLGIGTIIYEEGKGCHAELKVNKDFDETGYYPCFGFRANKNKDNEFVNCETLEIGLCSSGNADKGIKHL